MKIFDCGGIGHHLGGCECTKSPANLKLAKAEQDARRQAQKSVPTVVRLIRWANK